MGSLSNSFCVNSFICITNLPNHTLSTKKNRFGISNHSYSYYIDKTSGYIDKVVPIDQIPKIKTNLN